MVSAFHAPEKLDPSQVVQVTQIDLYIWHVIRNGVIVGTSYSSDGEYPNWESIGHILVKEGMVELSSDSTFSRRAARRDELARRFMMGT